MEGRSVFGLTTRDVEDSLICRVCSEKYDDSCRAAKFLRCLHGVCVACLGKSVPGDEQVFKCPVCQQNTPFPESGVQGLPDNFIVKTLRDSQCVFESDRKQSRSFICGSCKDGGPAVSYCSDGDCANFLCENCKEAHGRLRIYDGHVVIPLEQLENQPEIFISRKKPRCSQHHKQALTLFCNEEGCQLPICLVCVPTAHQGHGVVDLDQKSIEVKKELQILAQAARKKKGTVEEISGRISTEINQTSSRFEEMASALSEMFEGLQRQLKTAHEAVNDALKKQCLDRTAQLKYPTNFAELLVSQCDSACQFAETACVIGNPVDLLKTSEQIISRLQELIALDVDRSLPFHPADEAFLSFTENHDQVLSDIEKLIPILGQFNTSIADPTLTQGFKVTFPGSDESSLVLNATHRVRICALHPSRQPLDRLGGELHAYLLSPDGSSLECKHGEQCGDFYELQFRPLVAGPHQLNISVSGVPITSSPFPVVVVDNPSGDGQAEQSQDEVCSDLTWTDAFVHSEHTIIVKFKAPEHRLPRVSNLSAQFSMSRYQDQEDKRLYAIDEPQIVETDDSQTFRIVYTPPDAGELRMSVFVDGQPIANSPFVINVDPLHPDSTAVSTHQLGKCPLNTAVLNMPYTISLQTYDGFGQQLTNGGYDVKAAISTSSSEEVLLPDDIIDSQDGRYKITFTPRSVKLHSVTISICGYPVKSPIEISVLYGLPFENPSSGYEKPTGMDVDNKSKTVYVVDSRHACKLYVYDIYGRCTSELPFEKSTLPNKSCQIGVNEAGQLVLLIFHLRRVITCSTDGEIEDSWECAAENKTPANLTLSKEGQVIVGDSQSQELFIYGPKGEVRGRILLQDGSLEVGMNNVSVDRNLNILVATHCPPYDILRYSMTGNASSRLVSPAQNSQLAAASTPEGALIVSVPRGILVLEFSHDLMEVAVVKEFQIDDIYTKLAVVNDGCFVAFDPGAKHLTKYSYKPYIKKHRWSNPQSPWTTQTAMREVSPTTLSPEKPLPSPRQTTSESNSSGTGEKTSPIAE
ncbi:uncharacterized protein LOC119735244 [Patiria miniata]|uniref:RING-type domain-containing protein n=1 Tax=Patiria miniata TaxID=46514 RepID=A0A914AMB1_PATMI|nr:uncharacterized protein LOC119735244 [Patiria miniata]